MRRRNVSPALAFVAAGLTASGLALTALPAYAATPRRAVTASAPAGAHASPHRVAAAPHRDATKAPSKAQLAQIRARQHRLALQRKAAPTFAKAAAKTFTVNTTEDSELAASAGKTCTDAATGQCSLRAAVEAANTFAKPVKILLGKHTYTLSQATNLVVTNPKGVSIVGKGAHKTAIAGAGSRLFMVSAPSSSAPSGELFLTSLKLKNGSADDGAAVYLDGDSGATVVLSKVIVNGNTASESGGAIYADDYDGIYISDSRLTDNHAVNGGAIYAYWSSIKITGSTLDGNSTLAGSYGYGGAIYDEYGILDVTGGSISGNTAGDGTSYYGEGGAIYDEEAQTTLTNVHVDHNTVTPGPSGGGGGAIYSYIDTLEVTGGTMSHNHATGPSSGGAIYTEYGTTQGLHRVMMAGNRAGGTSGGSGGGAIYYYADFYPAQLVIDRGTKIKGSNNGAVYLYAYEGGVDATISNSTLTNNTNASLNGMAGEGCGGAVCAYSYYYGAINLEMSGNQVSGNTSSGSEGTGGVEIYGYEYSPVSVQLRHNVFTKNRSKAGGYGGAVGAYSYDEYSPISIRMAANKFIANAAGTQADPGYGGGLFTYDYVSIIDHGSTFIRNRAIGDESEGGAVGDYGYVASTFTRSTFKGNSAGMNHAGNEGQGGAYYSEDYSGGTFTQVTMVGNKAASAGGAFYGDSDDYQTTFKSSTISNNTVGNDAYAGIGAGIYVEEAVLVVENSTLTGNRALSAAGHPGQGGAIFHGGHRLDLRYSTVSGNYAKEGGGIYSDAHGGSVVSSIVSRNRTSPSGSENDCAVEARISKLNSLGGNVLGKGNCVTGRQPSDKVTKNLHLGKLKDNGGPTKTMAISAKSPAVGRATWQVPHVDQRGHHRPRNHADSGAFELPKVKHHH